MHHELMEPGIAYDMHGRQLYVWRCACGKNGSGSPTMARMRTAYKRHLKQSLRRGYY